MVAIALPADGFDVVGGASDVAKLASEIADVGPDKRAGACWVAVVPDVHEQSPRVEDFALVLHEIGEQARFDVREVCFAVLASERV